MARAFVGGLQMSGIAATAKHFPGLGLASGNTDNGRIVIRAPAWKLHQGLLPFKSAIEADVKLVMVSTADRIPRTATRAMLAGSDLLIFGAERASERGYSTLLADQAGSTRLQNRLTPAAGRTRALKAWLAAHDDTPCTGP